MKCEDCGFQLYEGASSDCPYPHTWCAKGHWESSVAEFQEATEETGEDPWKDCKDFQHVEQPDS